MESLILFGLVAGLMIVAFLWVTFRTDKEEE